MIKTIRVTGKGQIKVKPDVTRITLTLTGCYPEYGQTIQKSSEETEELKRTLLPCGFEQSELKTLRFDVDTKYESYTERNKYKERFVGYDYTHVLKIEFASDHDRLGKILFALAHCSVQPEFLISYTVGDPEAAKNEVLGKAITDAQAKAVVLAQAAGVALKKIQSIDYSWGEMEFEVRPMQGVCMGPSSMVEKPTYRMDIEPDDISVSDTVTVVWEITGITDNLA